MEELREQLLLVDQRIGRAVAALAVDRGCSATFAAVVREFHKSSQHAVQLLTTGSEHELNKALWQLDQAGRSAQAAAEAEWGASPTTRQAVTDAQASVSRLHDGR